MMIEGEMELEVNGTVYALHPDDGLAFEASVPHTYRNVSGQKAKCVLMISYQ